MKHYKIYGATCYSFEVPVGKDQIVRVEFMPKEDDTENVSTFYIGLLVYDKRKRNHALNRWIGLVNLDEDGYVRGDKYPITGRHQLETFAIARKLFLEGIEAVRSVYCSSSLPSLSIYIISKIFYFFKLRYLQFAYDVSLSECKFSCL